MKTEYLPANEEGLKRAAEIIKRGGLVAFPTETVYGLGGNALDGAASKKIYEAKGRPSDNPLIVHIQSFDELSGVALEIPEAAKKLAKAFWPGPLTMVLKKTAAVPPETTGGLNTVAVRLPSPIAARRFIRLSGVPIAGPSANTSKRPSPTMWEHVRHDLDGKIDACICGAPCEVGIESTIIDLSEEKPEILRPGYITPEKIEEVLGVEIGYDPAILEMPKGSEEEALGEKLLAPKAPGMKYKHYAPKAPLTLFHGEARAVERTIKIRKAFEEMAGRKVAVVFSRPEDPKEAAKEFFAKLREEDEKNPDMIFAAAPEENGELTFSVMNRMLKAAAYDIVEV